MNITTFTVPAIELSTDSTSYRGNEIELPTHVIQPGKKEVTFNYIISQDYLDYMALQNWFLQNAPVNKDTNYIDTGNVQANGQLKTCDIDVALLSPYKKPILGLRYKNCYIKSFSELQLSYAEQAEIPHSFTCSYTHFVILDLAGLEQRMKNSANQSQMQAQQDFLDRFGQDGIYGDASRNDLYIHNVKDFEL